MEENSGNRNFDTGSVPDRSDGRVLLRKGWMKMGRLTEQDEQGNWCVKGLPWKDTYVGQVITENTNQKIYGALCKLKDYENSGMDPEEACSLKELNTPIIPEFEGDGTDDTGKIILDTWICPRCRTRYEVDYDRYFYCPNCERQDQME